MKFPLIQGISKKHGIDSTLRSYYLRLALRPLMGLVIEKEGSQVHVGHYYERDGDLIGDLYIVWTMIRDTVNPGRIEQVLRDTLCSFIEGGKRMIYSDNIKEFKSFQRIFTQNIMEQGWLDDGVNVEND